MKRKPKRVSKLRPFDIVECPECHEAMLEVRATPIMGQKDWAKMFRPMDFSGIVGAKPICPHCKTMFINALSKKIYIRRKGWII